MNYDDNHDDLDHKRSKRRNRHAKELWENKDYRIKVVTPKTRKRKNYRPTDIMNMSDEELENLNDYD